MNNIIGFIPAAGHGTRMKEELVIKELLPVLIPGMEVPKLLFENSLISMKKAQINNIICTTNEKKPDLLKYMNIFSRKNDMSISYIFQDFNSDEYGLPYAISQAAPFLYDHTVVMRFPDTMVIPDNCVGDLLDYHYQKQSILTLGVFETEHPERLAPVILSETGEIMEIQDKPQYPLAKNTWNCVIWEKDFLDVVEDLVTTSRRESGKKSELLLRDAFEKCIDNKLPVYGMKIIDGKCIDISTSDDYIQLWKTV